MCVVLVIVAVGSVLRRGTPATGPVLLALLAVAVTLNWITFVAGGTGDYLSSILGKAVGSMIDLASGEGGGRQLFETAEGQVAAPIAERLVALAGVAIPLLLLPVGLALLRKRRRGDILASILRVAAVGVFASYLLRFTPAAWETGNRASEFLYIGLGVVAGVGADWLLQYRYSRRLVLLTSGAAAAIIVTGRAPHRLARVPLAAAAPARRRRPHDRPIGGRHRAVGP